MAHAAFVRSPFPHAMLRSIDADEARRLPGVVAVITGAEMRRFVNPLMGLMSIKGLANPPFYPLAIDKVRLVGDPLAIVVAESRAIAEDAAALVRVGYELLNAVANVAQALAPGAPRVWDEVPGNVMLRESHSYGDVEGAFAASDRIVTATFAQHRYANVPLETLGVVAEITADGSMTVHAATQSPHMLGLVLGMTVRKVPIRTSLAAVFRHRARLRSLIRNMRDRVARQPELKKAMGSSLPTMLGQFVRHPSRLWHLTRMSLPLVADLQQASPRVLAAQDIGGAFGVKGFAHKEQVAVCAAALHLGRSVKWIEDRREHLLTAGQAREETLHVEAAVTTDGTILGMKVSMTMDQGAYPGIPFPGAFFAGIIRTQMPGPYRLKGFRFDTTVIASNKATYVAYRGPWEVETWVRERMIDVIAREIGVDPIDLRLQNMFGADDLPVRMVTGPTLDAQMSAKQTLSRAVELSGYRDFAAKRNRALAEGRYLGIGFATYIEAAPGPPDFMDSVMPGMGAAMIERARVKVEADGSVSVFTSQSPHGQGHETTLAQVAADQLGVALEQITVVHGDSSRTPFSVIGTGGSRGAPMAGGAVTYAAREIRRRILAIASVMFEAAIEDLELVGGTVRARGAPHTAVTFSEVVRAAAAIDLPEGVERELNHVAAWDGGIGGWSQATHVCWVEVDPGTGIVTIPRYLVVEDCGRMINPAIVDGQIRGGVAQGIGAVLYERSTYDESGHYLASTFMDYLLPTVMEIPDIEVHHLNNDSAGDVDYRGVGEGGMIGAPAAITNAIEDALAPFGASIREQYLPPTRILALAGITPDG
jgi:carbon-monoxide dehydrogenase large subunit